MDPPDAIGAVSDRKMFLFSAGWIKAVVELAVDDSGNIFSGTGVWVFDGIRWTRIKASRSWYSLNSLNGSRFEEIVPENRTGS